MIYQQNIYQGRNLTTYNYLLYHLKLFEMCHLQFRIGFILYESFLCTKSRIGQLLSIRLMCFII